MLKQAKARVIHRTPFTIQLLYDTTEHIQPVTVGIDDGGINIGIAAVSNGKVLFQQELVLRSDIMQKPNNHKSVTPIPPPLNQRFRRGLFGEELNFVSGPFWVSRFQYRQPPLWPRA
ncbi:MAG: RRXRR domain-containing protein [Desulfobacterium sp.]